MHVTVKKTLLQKLETIFENNSIINKFKELEGRKDHPDYQRTLAELDTALTIKKINIKNKIQEFELTYIKEHEEAPSLTEATPEIKNMVNTVSQLNLIKKALNKL